MLEPVRILLVDDNPYFLEAAVDFLSLQEGLTVTGTATGGEEALLQALQRPPDIVLLDLNLGEHSGLALIPVFKEQNPAVKIIVLTSMQEAGYCQAARRAGADGFVEKINMSRRLTPVILALVGRFESGEIDAKAD